MPATTTATWPDLVAGRKAKASEVEAKFDWIEGTLWPMMSGTTADLTYDLGASGKSWKSAWMGSINPTTTASGVAIGKDSANASTCLDMSAMPKAMLMPILTTAQRNALTPTAGMMIYNSTNSRMERYEGGQWLAMNNPYGFKFATNNFSTTAWVDIVNTTTSGMLKNIYFTAVSGTLTAAYITVTIDGTALNTITSGDVGVLTACVACVTPLNTTATEVLGMTTATFPIAFTSPENLNISFNTSIRVQMRAGADGGAGAQGRGTVLYEAA